MVRKILIAFLILTAPVFAGQVTINSLPYTISTSNDTFSLASSRMYSTGNGVTFGSGVDGSVLNLGTDTIVFGTASGDNAVGVAMAGAASPSARVRNCKILGGVLIHDPADSLSGNYTAADTICSGARGITMQGWNNLIDGTEIHVRGHGTIHGIYIGSGAYTHQNRIRSAKIWNRGYGYERRDYYQATAIKIENQYMFGDPYLSTYSGTEDDFYHLIVVACSIMTNPHAAIVAYARFQSDSSYVKVILDSNYILVDARNDDYSIPSGNILHGTANAYGIVITGMTGGSMIRWNTIRSGSQFTGGRGIYCGSMRWSGGSLSDTAVIAYNDIDIHQGPGPDYPSGMDAHGLRIRQADIRNLHVHNNVIRTRADDDAGTLNYSHTAMAIRISPYQGVSEGVIIENNQLYAYCDGVATECYGISFDSYTVGGENLIVRNNHIYSHGVGIGWGQSNSGADNIGVGPGDTIEFLPGGDITTSTYAIGYLSNNWDCSGNSATDHVYIGDASPDDIAVAGGGTLELTVRRNITIRALGAVNALPRSGATITVLNDYDDTVLVGTSTSAGLVTGAVTMLYETRVGTDSALDQFRPFRAYAEYGDSVAANINWIVGFNTAESALVTLSIPGVSGDGSYANQSPQITSVYPSGVTFNFGDTIEPRFSVTDDNGIQYTFLWLRRAGGELIPGTSSDSFLVAGQYFSSGFPTAYSDTGSYVLNFSGNFTIRAIVVDTAGARVVQTSTMNYSTPGTVNTPPSFTSITPSNTVLRVGQATAYSYAMTDDQGLDSAIGWVLRPGGTILDTLFRQSVSGGAVTINGSYTPGSTDTGFVWFVGRVRDDSTTSVTDSCALINYVEKEYPTVMRARDGVTFRGAVRIRSGGIMTEVPPYVEED